MEQTSCVVKSAIVDVFEFGKAYDVELALMQPALYESRVTKRMPVDLFEGGKQIAYGAVIDMYDEPPTRRTMDSYEVPICLRR